MNKKDILKRMTLVIFGMTLLLIVTASSCRRDSNGPKSGEIVDEAMEAGRALASFPAADEDYFHDMDGAIALSPEEIKGRNTWIVWTGGNDRLWDRLTLESFGALDFLKTISSHPSLKAWRGNRWERLGLVNEPGFEKATEGDANRFGLWLDKRSAGVPPDPFENEQKYPGSKVRARGKNMPVGSYYGWATGIVGLRLFPNPDFNEAAAKKWDAERYYTDPDYYNSKDLVRPYRVGMSCAFCHVGPNPIKPPDDPENPKWENLSSNVGAQYFWIDRIFSWEADKSNYVFQMFMTSRPGTVDTSLVSSDNINNPRTMNAVYSLEARLKHAKRFGKETLAGGNLNNKQFNELLPQGSPHDWLRQFFEEPATVYTPRVLKDGSDSVGGLGALNRVYLNIGLFSEEWLTHFRPLVGGKDITPIEISVARKNSVYWQSTEAQTPNMALFFLKSTDPHKLVDAPGGAAFITKDQAVLDRGKKVFAENCARCHSSKLPEPAPGLDPGGCSGPDYLNCWNKYWAWTKTEDFKSRMREIVMAPDFLKDNFLSAEHRVPVTLLQTNACSPLATNAIRGNIWDNFSSETYKQLPSVGSITVYNPLTGAPQQFKLPGGGLGFTRPASLISLWSTAPFLLNNSVGKFVVSPSVQGRMESFQDSIEKMLWPEKRDADLKLGIKIPGRMDRTTEASYLRIAPGFVPDEFKDVAGFLGRIYPKFFGEGGIVLGPIPKGTPVGLLANINLRPENLNAFERAQYDLKLLGIFRKIKKDLSAFVDNPDDPAAAKVFENLVGPLMEVSKCPDYIVNRGHYFGTSLFKEEPGLSDPDKRALIEFLKTF